MATILDSYLKSRPSSREWDSETRNDWILWGSDHSSHCPKCQKILEKCPNFQKAINPS